MTPQEALAAELHRFVAELLVPYVRKSEGSSVSA